ncbi:putative ATP-grasp-modified RiPP [Streptomyces sp. FXJ1.4098]|uniref:putative ATP-grasp-modified RiPP n=1 Tax=Streptomyces sp. NPDC020845 TaxID=3365096 RepID=UPI002991833A|nr:putative ATP-grasp-modified RiPP [Streptomyces sp. FXJ1.4098]
MQQATAPTDQVTPWGLGRLKPFPDAAVLPAARPVLDPHTQVPVWVDPDGTPMPTMDKHKRSETSKETKTKTSLDGNPDQGSDQQGDTD